jgi:hypothetical protein
MYMEENFDEIDPEAARLAFEALQPELDQLDEVRAGTTDRRKAINHAASVGRAVKQPEVRAEFESMPGHRFDMQHVDRLESAALAAWFAAINLQDASVLASGAKLSDELLSTAATVKQRMQRVLEYNADHLSDVVLKLADIRGGTGHIDLADDLMRLARLYDAHRLVLEVDVRHYLADDSASAKRLSQAINQVLGDGRHSDAQYWNDYMGRTWTLLVITYEEVAAAGRWLFRDENGEARFPSLYTVGRQPRRPRRDDGEGGELPGDEVGLPALPALPADAASATSANADGQAG